MSAPLQYGLYILWIVLITATLAAFIINKIKQTAETKNIMLRVKSWWMIILVFTALFFTPAPWASIIFAAVALIAGREIYLKAIASRDGKAKFFAISVFIITIISIFCWYILFSKREGAGYFFFVVVITQFNDVAQYIWGKSCGRKQIAPDISPSKTWGGFLGGIFTSALLAFFMAPYYTEFKWITAVIVGACLAVFGFLGDLTISAFKRTLKTKDMGTLIPGHGGIMDRIDSLLYTIPLFLLFIVIYS